MKIAIIGAGIAGHGAALALMKQHDVTLYEKEPRAGGHSATVCIDYDGTLIDVDTGFIVYNTLNYPNLTALFQWLGAKTMASDMSLAVSMQGGKSEWAGDGLHTLYPNVRSLFSLAHHKMLLDVVRFNYAAASALKNGLAADVTLRDWLAHNGFRGRIVEGYLLPMTAAIWSMPPHQAFGFPAAALFRFFDNHRLLHWKRPVWRTVQGGSQNYVALIAQKLGNRLRTSSAVQHVRRTESGVEVMLTDGEKALYDHVIMAAHSDQSLAMLADPTTEERAVLQAVRYRESDVFLHRDFSLMPKTKKVWASWNVVAAGTDEDAPVSVHYYMNRLQHIDFAKPLFVSLDPHKPPAKNKVFGHYRYAHPQFDRAALEAQGKLDTIQGKDRIWYCGAWTGYGFHEDGLVSGLQVAKRLGGAEPWL